MVTYISAGSSSGVGRPQLVDAARCELSYLAAPMLASLHRLLLALFSAQELRVFLAVELGVDLTDMLPEPPCTPEALAFAAVRNLLARGLVDDALFAALIRVRPSRAEEIRAVASVPRPVEPASTARIAALDEFCTRCSVRPGAQPRSCSSIRGHQFTQAPNHVYCRVCGCVPGHIPQPCIGGREVHAFASADALPRCTFCGHAAGTRTTCSGLRSTHEFMA